MAFAAGGGSRRLRSTSEAKFFLIPAESAKHFSRSATEKPALERLQQLAAGERLQVLGAAVALRDCEVVLQRAVCGLQRVVELVAFEQVVIAPGLVAGPILRVDGPAHGPDCALFALDPDDYCLRGACVVDSVDDSLGEAALRRFPPHGPKDTIGQCSDSQACCARRSPFSPAGRAR